MLVLINTNQMVPPIAPIGLDYVAGAARRAGIEADGMSAEQSGLRGDHNYNRNQLLADAIAAGARGAYWDILRRLRRP